MSVISHCRHHHICHICHDVSHIYCIQHVCHFCQEEEESSLERDILLERRDNANYDNDDDIKDIYDEISTDDDLARNDQSPKIFISLHLKLWQ